LPWKVNLINTYSHCCQWKFAWIKCCHVLVRVLNQYVFTWPCLFSDVVIEFCTCFVLHDKRIVIAVNCKFVHHHHYMCLYGKMCGVSS
jgi:hypothetical protein